MTVLERIFAARRYLLGLVGAFTLFAGFHATQLTFEAAPDAHLPRHHPIAAAARALGGGLFRDERLAVALRVEQGSLFAAEGTAKIAAVKRAIEEALGSKTPLGGSDAPVTELSPDGRSALISAAWPKRGIPNIDALEAKLWRAAGSSAGGAVYRVQIFTAGGGERAFGAARLPLSVLCAVSALVLAAGLLLYSGSFAITGLALVVSGMAVAWTLGLWRLLAGSLEPSLALLAFLIFAFGMGQAFALARPLLRALARGMDSANAARFALGVVAKPSAATIGASALALSALALVPIPLVEKAAELGALGSLLLLPASLFTLPLALASVALDRPQSARRARANKPVAPVSAARSLARRRLNEVAVVMLLGFALVAVTQARSRPLGHAQAASAALPLGAPRGEASARVTRINGSPFDQLVVIAQTPPDGCTSFRVMDYLDRLSWSLRNLKGVSKVDSLAFALKAVAARAHDGDPRWHYVPRDMPALIEGVGTLAGEGKLVSGTCSVQPIVLHVADAHAAAIGNVRDAVMRFAAENPSEDVRLSIAGPLAEIAAAGDALRAWEATVLLCVTAAFVTIGFAILRDWSAALGGALVALLPVLGIYWGMGARGFALSAETLPLVVFALVLAADGVFGVVAAVCRAARFGHSPATAWRQALVDQGFVAGAKALCFTVAFGLWLFSPVRLQAESGLMILIAAIVALVLALGALPALVLFLEEAMASRAAQGFPSLAEEAARFRARMRAATGR